MMRSQTGCYSFQIRYLMKSPNDLKKYREINRLLSMYWINAIGADAFLFDGLKFLKISRVRQIQ